MAARAEPNADFFAPEAIPMKREALLSLQRGLHLLGADEAWTRATATSGAVIFIYHSVPSAEETRYIDPRNRMAPHTFVRQMEFLARHRRVIGLPQLLEHLARGEDPPPQSVVITFDDGYRDNLEYVGPLLASFGFPATLYLPTQLVSRGESPWADQLYTAFAFRTRQRLWAPLVSPAAFDLREVDGARRAFEAVSRAMLGSGRLARDELLDVVLEQLQPSEVAPRLTMTWDEIRLLRERHPSFTLGVHTANHLDLTALEPAEVRRELAQSIDDFTRELGEAPAHFAYPYSRESAVTQAILREYPFASAVAGGKECLIRSNSDPLGLLRLDTPHSMSLYGFWSSGAYPSLPLRLTRRA